MTSASAAPESGPSDTRPIDRVFRAALFDMDGTLIDSTPAVDRSWIRWGQEWGIHDSFREGMHGRPARSLIAELVAPAQVEAALARVQQLELADVDGITVLEGAAELISSLPDDRRAIVTSCNRDLAPVRLRAADFPAPSVVVTIDDTPRGKPNPDPFLEGARRLGFDAADCVVFEDAPAGLAAGRAAGCFTVGIAGTHPAHELDADLVVRSLTQVSVRLVDGGFTLVVAP
ncbi:HAD-IA family hydrolase [Subtercola frigoramans]|uniref:Sugar-phosphatase n=1 Tax=Subtercola frigoramans TaxID=120298 RepID=A0ABS2LA24_9MICO|nr:HAD-IA family hydrolase [Subtercola frigoramans]MBM7473600.1 sugar-phosphatase [Subtercola frigoramans]